jgi:predicted transcriptional regulator of viral defense system
MSAVPEAAEDALIEAAHRRRTTGAIRLDPAVKSFGRMTKRWGLWVNVDIDGAAVDT